MLAMTPMLLASLLMVTMVLVTTLTALLTVMVAMTAIMLVTYLSAVKLLVKERKKVKPGQHFKGGGDDNLRLDVPINNETNIGDGNDDVLNENRNNEGGKDVGNDANVIGLMVTMVMVTTVMALLTVMVASTTIMLVTHLSVVMLSVKEKRK